MNVLGYVTAYESSPQVNSFQKKIQRQKIESFCKLKRLNLLEILVEPEQSRPDYRPMLVKILNEAPKKSFSDLIVFNFKVLSEKEELRNWIITELKKYDITVHSISEEPETRPIAPREAPAQKFKSIKHKIRDLPSLPEVVTKVTELVQNPNSSAAQLGKIISQDSGLTSRVLRLVNSAYYGFPKQISSIQHAVMILGFTTIRGLVLSSSIFRMFTPKGNDPANLDYKKFWKHSLLTAIASKRIYQKLFFEEDENIFSAAILHDIGKLILDQYDHDNYVFVLKEARNQLHSDMVLATEQKHCGITHPTLGSMIAESWNLPEILTDVISFHHNPLQTTRNQKIVTVVHIGNIISQLILDVGIFNPKLFDQKVLEKLGIDAEDIGVMYSEIREDADQLEDLESFFK